jgi:hypothetical protein
VLVVPEAGPVRDGRIVGDPGLRITGPDGFGLPDTAYDLRWSTGAQQPERAGPAGQGVRADDPAGSVAHTAPDGPALNLRATDRLAQHA